MAKLMHGYHTSQHHKITYGDVPRQGTVIRENAVIAHDTVVRDMAISLNQAIFADNGLPLVFRAAVYRHALADGCVIADFGGGFFAVKLQVLRNARNNSPRENPAIFAN